MSHLNVRISQQDEMNILLLKAKWPSLDRSEVTRKALAIAASMVEAEQRVSKEKLLSTSTFIGSERTSKVTSTNYKEALKSTLRKKHGC